MSTAETGESRPSLVQPAPSLTTAALQKVPSAVRRSPSEGRAAITLGITGGGRNAGLLAVQILGAGDAALRARVSQFKRRLAAESAAKDRNLQGQLANPREMDASANPKRELRKT